ncbi:hypothetical protein CRUP_003350 [Coryphaenoides rupestris]|nr:hypothetical protein CRUP_003350 [Coryphaenoides rupestris]
MVALGLVTTDYLEELQAKRQERKRRSTANPAYSSLLEPERKRLASNFLNNPLFMSQDTEDVCWKEGELQPCHNCARAYHPDCLQPPLKTPPRGSWYCPKCQKKVLNKENMSWPQNFVQSYVTHKTVRQEEKRRLLRRNVELKKECAHLEEQDKMLNTSLEVSNPPSLEVRNPPSLEVRNPPSLEVRNPPSLEVRNSPSLERCMDVRERLLGQQRSTQASLERVKALIRLIQRDQVIQLTMTATTTTAEASLLSLPWMKPSSGTTSSSSSSSNTSSSSSSTTTTTTTSTAADASSVPVGPSELGLLQRGPAQVQGHN